MKSKVWFITGASKGFGFEIAKAALASGDLVVGTVRKNAAQLAAQLGGGDRVLIVTLDVTNEKQVQAGVEAAIDRFKRIDVLVNNAGYGLLAATESYMNQFHGSQPGDPAKLGAVILQLAVSDVKK